MLVLSVSDEVGQRTLRVYLLCLVCLADFLLLGLFLAVAPVLQKRVNELVHAEGLRELHVEQERLFMQSFHRLSELILDELDDQSDHVAAHEATLGPRKLTGFVISLGRHQSLPFIQLSHIRSSKFTYIRP